MRISFSYRGEIKSSKNKPCSLSYTFIGRECFHTLRAEPSLCDRSGRYYYLPFLLRPSASEDQGGSGWGGDWHRNDTQSFCMLFFRICECITNQNFLLNFSLIAHWNQSFRCCWSQLSVDLRLVVCLVYQESSKIHLDSLAVGANDAAQAWHLLLPLGGQCWPSS